MTHTTHWEQVYATKGETEVSWFQENPAPSLDMIDRAGAGPAASVIDIGGGASRLVDSLLDRGFERVTVLDIAETALAAARSRLGPRSAAIRWIAADITEWTPMETYDLWHDRAAFHFLTDEADRAAYADRLKAVVRPGGHAIIATFALDGPERCSNLPVMRHDAASVGAVLGPSFALIATRPHEHATPWGAIQRFQFSLFRHIRP